MTLRVFIAHLVVALVLMTIAIVLLVTGYISGEGWSRNPQHELVWGMVIGAIVGVLLVPIGLCLLSLLRPAGRRTIPRRPGYINGRR